MGREYLIQHALGPVYPYVADMVGLCRDEAVLGSDFYVMERLDGLILRKDLTFELSPRAASTLCEHAWEALVRLHEIDVPAVPDLAALGRGEGYVERQVTGWTDRLSRATTDDLGDWSDVTAWLAEHRPADSGQCLIHNDWRFDNMVLDPDDDLRVTGVLDWEMATVGDPLMDLGGALAYWVQADDDEFFRGFRRQPTTTPGMWSRQRVVDWYCERRGLAMTPERWRFYEAFGLFRLAVIIQQIWYRFVHGHTHNPAYAGFGEAVRYLEQRTRRAVVA
jgi:aminoglycoside phosphotransferase (APT) family kinase protein